LVPRRVYHLKALMLHDGSHFALGGGHKAGPKPRLDSLRPHQERPALISVITGI
jgi:hypothetical protein